MILAKLGCQLAKANANKSELRWFLKAFCHPKTWRENSPEEIDKLKAMIWDNPSDDMLPSDDNFFF